MRYEYAPPYSPQRTDPDYQKNWQRPPEYDPPPDDTLLGPFMLASTTAESARQGSDPPGTQWLKQQTQPTVLDQARQQWPILNQLPLQFKYTPRTDQGYLEAWPPGETGDQSQPRPKEFAPDQYGIEVYRPDTRPIDVLGDVVSHFMIKTDPRIKAYYDQFSASITPDQERILRDQYQYAKQREGEKRPYKQWRESSGLPAYFRGYAFQQWPKQTWKTHYTPQQRTMLNDMLRYLGSGK